MHASNLRPCSSFSSSFLSKTSKAKSSLHTSNIQLKPRKESIKKSLIFTSFKCMQSCDVSVSRSLNDGCSSVSCSDSVEMLNVAEKVNSLASEFKSLTEPIDRVKRLLDYATLLPPFDEAEKIQENRVMGCTAQVWLEVKMVDDGLMRFRVDSDSEITKGFCSCLIWLLDCATPEEVLSVKIDDLFDMNVGLPSRGHSRVNTWHNVLISMQKRTKDLMEEKDHKRSLEDFSSLIVWPGGTNVYKSYNEAQSRFSTSDKLTVEDFIKKVKEKEIELSVKFHENPVWQDSNSQTPSKLHPEAGCQYLITVLRVDFMSKDVHAILDQAGFGKVITSRLPDNCTVRFLPDSSVNAAFMNFLEAAELSTHSLYVIYIDTSPENQDRPLTLAAATFYTSSASVTQSILQVFAQIPILNTWYRPESRMLSDIQELFQKLGCTNCYNNTSSTQLNKTL